MGMRILLIEDDAQLATHVRKALEHESLAVDTAGTAEDGLFQATEFEYDGVILDVNLPDGNGFDVCKKMRSAHVTTPILMLTARDALSDKILGLDLGADEYVTKPIDTRELLARVRALIRRNSKDPLPLLNIGDLTIDPKTRRVRRKNVTIDLPSKEYAVLEFLARHSDEVVTRAMIMEHVWGSDFETFSNVIDVYMKNLRKKIDMEGQKKLLHTIRGGGYVLSDKR